MTDDERALWLEGAEYYGDAIEDRNLVPVMEQGEIDTTVSFPAVKYDKDPSLYPSAKPVGFRQVYFKTFWDRIDGVATAAEQATQGLAILIQDANDAIDDAEDATAAAQAATAEAENVNAQLSGLTVTITDRNGTSRTVDMSFDFYNSYASVAAMNADAANIPLGKLVSIATTDPTSSENARIYQKRSDGLMIYIADLDQASASAWADWLENEKPVIEQAISDANEAAEDANEAAASVETELSKLTGDLYPRFEVNVQTMMLVVHHVDSANRFTLDNNGYLHVNV